MSQDKRDLRALPGNANASFASSQKRLRKKKGYTNQRTEYANRNLKVSRQDDPEVQPEVKYRNRALERSKMKDEYYIKAEEQFQMLKKQTVEESRYMVRRNYCTLSYLTQGGDEEHTHMVKGLDYVLLEKVKSKMETRPKIESIQPQEEKSEMGHSDLGLYIYKNFFYHTHPQNRHFRERLDKTYNLLLKGYKFKHNVKPPSQSYIFDLKLDIDQTDVPSIVLLSDVPRAGISDTSAIASVCIDLELKNEICEAFEWNAENRKKKREDRLPFRPSKFKRSSGTAVADDGDDIFENVGEYKSDEYNVEYVAKLKQDEKYFDDFQAEEDHAKFQTPKSSFIGWKRPPVNDGYDECYPDAGNVDSDDENLGRTDKKAKGNRSEWKKIQKIIAEKDTIPTEQFEKMTNSRE